MIVRNKALELTQGLDQKDFAGEAANCFKFCRDNIRYVRDILDVETLHYPATILAMGCGDCDDKSILLASLLCAIGHRTRFIAIAFQPDFFEHVWTQVLLKNQWVDMEPTEPLQFGQRVPGFTGASYITLEV